MEYITVILLRMYKNIDDIIEGGGGLPTKDVINIIYQNVTNKVRMNNIIPQQLPGFKFTHCQIPSGRCFYLTTISDGETGGFTGSFKTTETKLSEAKILIHNHTEHIDVHDVHDHIMTYMSIKTEATFPGEGDRAIGLLATGHSKEFCDVTD